MFCKCCTTGSVPFQHISVACSLWPGVLRCSSSTQVSGRLATAIYYRWLPSERQSICLWIFSHQYIFNTTGKNRRPRFVDLGVLWRSILGYVQTRRQANPDLRDSSFRNTFDRDEFNICHIALSNQLDDVRFSEVQYGSGSSRPGDTPSSWLSVHPCNSAI